MVDSVPYEYVCERNHGITSPKEITQCPAYMSGNPCVGKLKRIGGPRMKKEVSK